MDTFRVNVQKNNSFFRNFLWKRRDPYVGPEVPEDLKELLKIHLEETFGSSCFPGSIVSDIDKSTIPILKKDCYYVSWKYDGLRVIVIKFMGRWYGMTRENSFHEINLKVPHFENFESLVFDCELILHKRDRVLIILDVLHFGTKILSSNLSERLYLLEDSVLSISNDYKRREGILLMKKVYIDSSIHLDHFLSVDSVFSRDGIIFTSQDGRKTYKQKNYPTVDMLLEGLAEDDNFKSYLLKFKRKPALRGLFTVRKGSSHHRDFENLSGKIIECYATLNSRGINFWHGLRIRYDKLTPNSHLALSQCLNIILEDDLTALFDQI